MKKPTPRQILRKRLTEGPMIVAPGIYDAYGARFVEQAGFEAVYMTGNGVSASLLGRPDVGLVDLTLIANHAHRVAACVDIPLICDADTGYGNAVNVRHTVAEFEAAGVAAIHLEDQVAPKRCGHLPGSRPVVEMEEHVGKIEAAIAARRDPDFIVIARTDAAAGLGLDEAIRRGKAYRKAGADVVFVELKSSPNMIEELKRVTGEIDAPCLLNVEEIGKLAELTIDQLNAGAASRSIRGSRATPPAMRSAKRSACSSATAAPKPRAIACSRSRNTTKRSSSRTSRTGSAGFWFGRAVSGER